MVLVIGRGIDLSAITLLRCTFFYNRVSRGAVVAFLTMFLQEGD